MLDGQQPDTTDLRQNPQEDEAPASVAISQYIQDDYKNEPKEGALIEYNPPLETNDATLWGLLQDYLQKKWQSKHTTHRIVGSFVKRLAVTVVTLPFKLIFKSPLMFPFKFISASYAGAYGKDLGARLSQKYQEEGFRYFIPFYQNTTPDSELITDGTQISHYEYKNIWENIKAVVVQVGEDTKTKILTTKPIDLVESSAGTIGSVGVTSLFVMVVGPPGFLALPALWLIEGPTKNISAELAKRWCDANYHEGANIELQEYMKMYNLGLEQVQADMSSEETVSNSVIDEDEMAIRDAMLALKLESIPDAITFQCQNETKPTPSRACTLYVDNTERPKA